MQPECYICTETSPRPWASCCLCKDRYVHRECLLKLLETRPDLTCPACAAPLRNVGIQKRTFCAPTLATAEACVLAALVLVLGVCGGMVLYAMTFAQSRLRAADMQTVRVLFIISASLFSLVTTVSVSLYAVLVAVHGRGLLLCHCVRTERIFHVTRPEPRADERV